MKPPTKRDDSGETDLSKRAWLTAAAGLGAVALTGCVVDSEAAIGETSEELSGPSVGWVDTVVSDLRALPSAAYPLVIAKGYHGVGDGGGGSFHWTADITASDDGGLVIVPTATTRTGCWKRVVGAHLDVRWFGARGNNQTPDQVPIQRAINACQARGGGVVLFPPGNYRTTASLRVSAEKVILQGVGNASTIVPVGDFDTIVVKAPEDAVCAPDQPQPWLYGVRINDLRFQEDGKDGGRTLYAVYVANFVAERIYGTEGRNGMEFDSFNNVTLNHPRLEGYKGGAGTAYVRLSGGRCNGSSWPNKPTPGRSDTARITQAVFGGNRSDGMKGIDIDGFVHTVNLANVHFVNIGAEALITRNTIGASDVPTFITAVDLEADYPTLECIRLDVGQQFTFIGSLLNGSRERANIYVGPLCRSADFTGGFSTGARQSGIAIAGQDVTISSMRFAYNAVDQVTDPKKPKPMRDFPGILLGATSRNVSVTGCRSGDPGNYQRHGCQIDVGTDDFANNFVIVGNVFTGNHQGPLLRGIPSSPGQTFVIANNL